MKTTVNLFAKLYCLIFFAVLLTGAAKAQNFPYILPGLDKLNRTVKVQNSVNQPTAIDLQTTFDNLIGKARETGTVKIIVGFSLEGYQPDAALSGTDQSKQRSIIKQKQASLLNRLSNFTAANAKQFDYIPFLAIEASAEALAALRESPDIVSLQEDTEQEASLLQSIPIIGANNAWTAGFTGQGRTVAILDTGVDKTHPFFSNRVVSEACYSTTSATTTSFCPGGASSSTAAGSGLNCNVSQIESCFHGTHVAGIAAGGNPQINGAGVAKNANIIAIQVFSRSTSCSPNLAPCTTAFTSDTISGLERVYALRTTFTIDSVNLSLGGGQYFSNCDTEQSAYKTVIDNLRAAGIATIVASGNESHTDSMASPACVSSAISVGSTNDGDVLPLDFVSDFSNSAYFLTLLAPGELILSAYPGGLYHNTQGTSMAAPHVAGAWAVMKQKFPSDTVSQTLTRLKYSGVQVFDARNALTKPRIRLDAALNTSNVDPCGTISPITAGTPAGGALANTDCLLPLGNRTDIYSFTGTQGQGVAITHSSTAFDTYVYLFNSSGALVAQDNNGGGGTNSRMPAGSGFLTLPASGTYYIYSTSFEGNKFGNYTTTLTVNSTPVARRPFDFDGDGKTDISIFRPSLGQWWYLKSSNGGNAALQFGVSTDKLTPADFTGDGKTDIAFWRPSTGEWFVLRSEDNSFLSFPFGTNGDVPLVGDFDGDGRADPSVFRPSNSTWYISKSTGGTIITTFGASSDKPVAADYDGDGRADIAIYRPSNGQWWIQRSSNSSVYAFQFGTSSDKPVQGDYTGDGKADAAFWRPSNGFWFILRSEDSSFYSVPFGTTGDSPAPGDYDGDGRFDTAVFRPSTNNWYIQRTTAGTLILGFGTAGDISVPSSFVP